LFFYRVILKIFFISLLLHINLLAQTLTPISIQLAWKYQFQFAGYIMAKEKGFYKDVGLDVELWEHDIGITAYDMVFKEKLILVLIVQN
jgi:polar amino acid transport system substrate-binding protein